MIEGTIRQSLSLLMRFAAVLAAVFALSLSPAGAQSGPGDDAAIAETLDQHGRWLTHSRYGEVWQPDVERGWRPYTRGQWVHTEEHGWYWESEEPFGWVVFHYGRWFLDERDGWLWVPGTEWGPAWVAWRYGEEDVGWAPLPPEAVWQQGSLSYASSFYDAPSFSPAWCFVPIALLAAPRIYTRIVTIRRNRHYLERTRFDNRYRVGQFGVYNGGFDTDRYSRLTGRRLVTHRIIEGTGPRRHGRNGNSIHVYRPRVTGITPTRRPDGPRGGQDGVERRRGGGDAPLIAPPINREDRRGREQRFGRDGDPGGGTVRRRPQPTVATPPPVIREPDRRRRNPPDEVRRGNPPPPSINREDGRGREQRYGRGHREPPPVRAPTEGARRVQPQVPQHRVAPQPQARPAPPPQRRQPEGERREGRRRGGEQAP